MSRWSSFEPIPLPAPSILEEIDDAMSRVHADEARISALENSEHGLRADLDQILRTHDDNFREISQALNRQTKFNSGISTGFTLLGITFAGYVAVDIIDNLSRRRKITTSR